MIRRTIEISSAARLSVKNRQLIIENLDGCHQVPFEDIGFLILDNPCITCTQQVFRQCTAEKVALITTDEKHLPNALLTPLESHTTHSKIIRMQVQSTAATHALVWQQIIMAKITAQADALLKASGQDNHHLRVLAKTVQLHDQGMHESQAARLYFSLLFGKGFRRNYHVSGINNLLNYGYALIRTACARALLGSGLHPALGVQHHNQYNAFCLADDIMEPLRPLIDYRVFQLIQEMPPEPIERGHKVILLETLGESIWLKRRKMSLPASLTAYCSSLRNVLEKGKGTLTIPNAFKQKPK